MEKRQKREVAIRKKGQGLWNVIRFNWHYYLFALQALMLLWYFYFRWEGNYQLVALILISLLLFSIIISLSVTFYIYDLSRLYRFTWLSKLKPVNSGLIVNIHAGFDETSEILAANYRGCEFRVFDFYDPVKHTEVSIRRARKAYLPFPGAVAIKTDRLPIPDKMADKVFLILAAHEIRDEAERVRFFRELERVIKPGGEIVVTEHLRDFANFLAYNFGFFHFHSKSSWKRTFKESGLAVAKEIKLTPFITTFILRKDGIAS